MKTALYNNSIEILIHPNPFYRKGGRVSLIPAGQVIPMQNEPLFSHPRKRYTRWFSPENPQGIKGQGAMSNHGHKGSACFTLKPGEERTILNCEGPGVLRHLWFTYNRFTDPAGPRSLWLDIYWDGAETPAVGAPFDDFFCQAVSLRKIAFENALFSCPEGRSFNCFIPMPFFKNARIVVTNTAASGDASIYYCIEATFGEDLPADSLYFHCLFQKERLTTLGQDFEILPKLTGCGRFLGCNVQMKSAPGYEGTWFGEGEVKIYVDGDEEYPTLAGTGTEDYILSGWGQREFTNAYSGCTLMENTLEGRENTSFYRLHVPDPVWFSSDCRVTLQQIGGSELTRVRRVKHNGAPMKPVSCVHLDGRSSDEDTIDLNDPDIYYANFLREDFLSAAAYVYLDRP